MQKIEAILQPSRLDAVKDALEGVVRRYFVKSGEKAAQPIRALFAKRFNLLPIFSATQDGTQSDDDDVGEQMSLVAIDARVFEFAEMVFDGKWGSQGNSSLKGDAISVPIIGVFT